VDAVTGVSAADVDTIGQGGVSTDAITAINDPALTQNGKPEVLFIGAEFCPFCAAERWSLVQALSRFGTFSDLKQIRSAVADGNLATFSFYKSSYKSDVVSFKSIEFEDRNQALLEKDSKSEDVLWKKYTNGGSFPFIYYGGKYAQNQVGFSDQDLSGKTWQEIADALKDPTNQLAKDIVGEANTITAMICKLTNGQPASVCSAKGVTDVTLPQASA
jgi:thiol-disulfide isomerase/thioredoxin